KTRAHVVRRVRDQETRRRAAWNAAEGSRHRATMLVQSMYNGECEALTRKVIDLGLAGDLTALKICADRLLPPLKSRPIKFALPELRTATDALTALAAIAEGISNGQLLAEEAEVLTATVSTFIKAFAI